MVVVVVEDLFARVLVEGVDDTCVVGIVVTLVVRGSEEDTSNGEALRKLKGSGSHEISEVEYEAL